MTYEELSNGHQSSKEKSRLGLSSASDGNQTGFKWDQVTILHPQNAAGSAQIAFQVFRVELTSIHRFTWSRWSYGEPTMDFRWSSKRILGVQDRL